MAQEDAFEIFKEFLQKLEVLTDRKKVDAWVKNPGWTIHDLLVDEDEEKAKAVSRLSKEYGRKLHPISKSAERIQLIGFFAAGAVAVLVGRRFLGGKEKSEPRSK